MSATAYYRGVTFPDADTTADHCFDAELPYGYGWIFPAVDGVSNVGVYLRADAYAGLEQQPARSSSPASSSVNADALRRRRAGRHGRAPGRCRSAPRPIPHGAPGLLLAGDAGGFVDPLSGEGIWQALHTGVLAGETARDAVRGGGLDAALVRDYERRCWQRHRTAEPRKAVVQRAHARPSCATGSTACRRSAAALAFGYRRRAFEMTKSLSAAPTQPRRAARS